MTECTVAHPTSTALQAPDARYGTYADWHLHGGQPMVI